MTAEEIAQFLGVSRSLILKCFKAAEPGMKSIKEKSSFIRTRTLLLDYTIEEAVYALSNYPRITFTPMMSRYLKEHYIQRDSPIVRKEKKVSICSSARSFMLFYRMYHNFTCCVTCAYFSARQMKKAGTKPAPHCDFYNSFLNKVKPHRDIYKSQCPTYARGKKEPIIWTNIGPFPLHRIYVGKGFVKILPDNTTLGIDNSKFGYKRKTSEPIRIIKDMFSED